jgi:hypothetical protein
MFYVQRRDEIIKSLSRTTTVVDGNFYRQSVHVDKYTSVGGTAATSGENEERYRLMRDVARDGQRISGTTIQKVELESLLIKLRNEFYFFKPYFRWSIRFQTIKSFVIFANFLSALIQNILSV